MALGGKMHDRVDGLVLHHLLHGIAVADVELVETVLAGYSRSAAVEPSLAA